MTTLSSREINQDIGRAKKAAYKGPVVITDRGKDSHVLLSIEEYRRLSDGEESVVDFFACDDTIDLEEFMNHRSISNRKVIFY